MKNHARLSLVFFGALAVSSVGCASTPPSRAPLQMVKIETSPGSGAYAATPPLALHSDIDATSSANDLDNSGPKVAEPPKEKAQSKAKFAQPEQHVGLSKHSAVPVGGNLHGYSR